VRRLHVSSFRRRGGRCKPAEALEQVPQDEVASIQHASEVFDLGRAPRKPQTCLEENARNTPDCSDCNLTHAEFAKYIEEHNTWWRAMVEERRLAMEAKRDRPSILSPAAQSAVVLEVTTIGGRTLSRRNVHPDTKVLDLKQSLAAQVGAPASRQRLVHDGTLLNDAHSLQDCKLSSQLWAARFDGSRPVQLSLVTLSDPVVTVPDDYGSISEAVASLPEAGGSVQLLGPPTVPQDVIEIRNPKISIIAVGCDAVDVRQARLYIKTPRSKSDSETHVRICGLANLSRAVVLGCGHNGSIVFKDCNLFSAMELHVRARGWSSRVVSGTLVFRRSECKYKRVQVAAKTMYLDYSKSKLHVTPISWPACSAPASIPSCRRPALRGEWKSKAQALEKAMANAIE